jgi:predicted nucleic acid-binding protein
MPALYYWDTSALVKLVESEPGSTEARTTWQTIEATHVTSLLGRIELTRVFAAKSAAKRAAAADLLQRLYLMPIDETVAAAAATLPPAGLRTLDAIHVASASTLAPDLTAVVTFDHRLGEAAALAGLPALTPSGPPTTA